MKKILFAYNPVAGQGKVQRDLFEIVDFYQENGYIVTLCPAIKLKENWETLKYGADYDLMVCSGGDGTLNMVMSFLMEQDSQMKVAYLPAGSTNDYAHSLGIGQELKAALLQTVSGEERLYDVGKFNGRYFLYVAGFGTFTKVSYSTPQKTKNVLGHSAYLLEGIKELSELRSYDICLETEKGEIYGSYILGLVTNSLFVGGFKDIVPSDSSLDDGQFEVLLLRQPKSLLDLREMVRALTQNSLSECPNVEVLRCSKLKITSKQPLDWTLDGEYGGNHTEVEIENIHKAFHIVC